MNVRDYRNFASAARKICQQDKEFNRFVRKIRTQIPESAFIFGADINNLRITNAVSKLLIVKMFELYMKSENDDGFLGLNIIDSDSRMDSYAELFGIDTLRLVEDCYKFSFEDIKYIYPSIYRIIEVKKFFNSVVSCVPGCDSFVGDSALNYNSINSVLEFLTSFYMSDFLTLEYKVKSLRCLINLIEEKMVDFDSQDKKNIEHNFYFVHHEKALEKIHEIMRVIMMDFIS